MRIAMIYPEPLPSAKARAVTVVNTACALARREVDVVLHAERGGAGPAAIAAAYGCVAADLVFAPLSRRGVLGLVRSNRFFNRRLLDALRANAADILYVRHLKAAAYLLDHRLPGQRLVFECHEIFHQTTEREERREEIRALEARVYRDADGLVFINATLQRTMAEEFGALAARQCIAWPGAMPPGEPNRNKPFTALDDLYYIGSLYPWKGVDTLLKAMLHVRDARLHLIGGADSGRRGEIEAWIARHGLRGRVFLEGYRPNREIRALLAERAALTILPNDIGPFARFTSPLKLFEYMVSGCAIVAADIETVREIGGESPPFLRYPPGDAQALAERIERLRADPDLARDLAQAAMERGRLFTWDVRAQRLARFFASVIAEAR